MKVGEILEIQLLNNANLSNETFTNAKRQLIQLAQAREEQRKEISPTPSLPAVDGKLLSKANYDKLEQFAD